MRDSINVKVKRVLYPPPVQSGDAGDFHVLLTDAGKASGKMRWRPEPNELLTLEGKWGAYRGERNFNFDIATPNVPVNPRDQLRYVASRTHGIGGVLEGLIWEARGEDWRNVEPNEVKGFSAVKHQALREMANIIDGEAEKVQAIGWLMGNGCSIKMAESAWGQFGRETVAVVQSNCYRLAELPNHSFADVDGNIREAFGITHNDPRRVRAGIVYKIRQLTSGGSTVIRWTAILAAVKDLIGAELQEMIATECGAMFEDGTLVGFRESESVSLMDDYRAEISIIKFLQA